MPAADAVPTVRHLDWCMQGFCEQVGSETVHRSAPIVWQMAGDDVDVVMRRVQVSEVGEAGEPTIEVHFAHRAYPEEITLSMAEVDVDRLFTGVHELRGCR